MIKLTKQVQSLESVLEHIEKACSDLADKQTEIEYRAADYNRPMTQKERERYFSLQDKIDELEDERSAVEDAISCLLDYAEED